jgi:pimeloyl-ACP methyl ester carboxylesterase
LFRALERTAPAVAGFWADRLFFSPPRKRPSPAVASALEAGQPFDVAFGRGSLPAWRWGRGPTVLLVHGWGSRAGHIASLAPALMRAGLSAVAFDAPAHGTAPGRRTSIVEMASALQAVAAACGPVHGIVAHSAGAPVVTLALRAGLVVSRGVFLAPTAGPDGFTALFAARLGLGPAGLRAMKALAERRIGVRWEALSVPDLARGLRVPLLIVHDRDDGEIGWSEGAAIADAWPGAELVTTSGLGHVRLLRDPEVAARAAAFLTETGDPPASCGHVRGWA